MSKDEQATQQKWTEIEHLPEWDEEYYDVYTAKKHGKWLMLKTLKPAYKDDPRFQAMIEKEFDVRYNLAHPNIIMINDFEEVPGLGMCIITDDVYGESLQKLIDTGKVDEEIVGKVVTNLVQALEYIQTNHIVHHPLTAGRVIFTENIRNLKVIDVGFDQKHHLTPADAREDIYNFGVILKKTLDAVPGGGDPSLRKIADRCMAGDESRRYRDVQALKSALNNNSNNKLYVTVIIFLVIMVAVLAWLSSSKAPAEPEAVKVEQAELSAVTAMTTVGVTSVPCNLTE